MTPAEAAIILAMASAFDNRKPDEGAAQAWAAALPDVRLEDAKEAVVTHYRDSTEWLKVAHVRRLVQQIRTDRLIAVGTPTPPRELADEPRRELRWVRDWRDAICDGKTSDEAIEVANEWAGVQPREVIEADPARRDQVFGEIGAQLARKNLNPTNHGGNK